MVIWPKIELIRRQLCSKKANIKAIKIRPFWPKSHARLLRHQNLGKYGQKIRKFWTKIYFEEIMDTSDQMLSSFIDIGVEITQL